MLRNSNIGLIHSTCLVLMFVLLIAPSILKGGEMGNIAEFMKIPSESWNRLSSKKIFFGHQSVGYNIIDGILDLMKNYPSVSLNITEVRNGLATPGFAHFKIGKNEDPNSKIEDFIFFANSVDSADIAFFKLCYIDVTEKTDIESLFNTYTKTMADLYKKFKKTKFIHFTLPLRKVQSGPKAFIKKMFGMKIAEYENNIRRNEYNDMLRKEYGQTGDLFDLAAIESTNVNGEKEQFTSKGKSYQALVPAYTYDIGHLNELGRQIVASELLLFLQKIE